MSDAGASGRDGHTWICTVGADSTYRLCWTTRTNVLLTQILMRWRLAFVWSLAASTFACSKGTTPFSWWEVRSFR